MNKLDEIKKEFTRKWHSYKNKTQVDDGFTDYNFPNHQEEELVWQFITEVYDVGVKKGGEKMLSEVLKVIPEEKEEEYLMIDGKVIKDGNYANSVFNQCRKQCIERIEELKK